MTLINNEMPSLREIGEPARLLDQQVSSVSTRPMRWLERSMLRLRFHNERLDLGRSQTWLDRDWELRIASVGGVIYKLGWETIIAPDEDHILLTAKVFGKIEESLGSSKPVDDGIWVWSATDGNVVLQLANVMGERRIMLFLTSSQIRSFS